MKTDSQLQKDILDELTWEPRIREAEVGVAVKDGVVTLLGYVDSFAQKLECERAAQRVGGVRVVADDLKVKLPGGFERNDTDLAHQVSNALAWDIEVPRDRIKARVENGWVWLEGEVDWQYERLAAERAVHFLTGVRGVTNSLRIKTTTSTYDVSKRIKAALHRRAESDANGIQVQANDGRVTLKGSVRTAAERMDAELAAWAAPGVRSVEDRIVVTP